MPPRKRTPSSASPPPEEPGTMPPAPPDQPPTPQPPDRPPDAEPQGPPPLPDLPRAPDVRPYGGGAEWPGPPDGRRTAPRPGIGILAGVVAVSLFANLVLAQRVSDTNGKLDEAQSRVTALNKEVDRLRAGLSAQQTTGSPIDRVMEAVTRIRGLQFEQKVDAEILSTAALRERILAEINKPDERAEVVATDKVLTALGLLEPEEDLQKILVGVQTEQIGGYYDSKTHKLVVGGSTDGSRPLDRYLLSHELTHAVTDQHYNLSRLDALREQRKDDEALALLALIEGDAQVVSHVYASDYLTDAERGEIDRTIQASPTVEFDKAPNVVRRSLLFPYEHGEPFCAALITRGGFALVDKAYKDPPTSTEQILHPTKYAGARRDEPQQVSLPDIAAAMGSGWKQIDAGGFGELDVQIMVDEYLPKTDANAAGEGWDGGRYVAVESGAGTLVVMSTVWDSDSEAREAGDILERWLQDRFQGRGTGSRIDGGRFWDAPTGAGAVVRKGEKVFVVVGPDKPSVEKARAAAGASGTSA